MQPNSALLLPVLSLVGWHYVMFFWMYATRIPAVKAARLRLDPTAPRGAQMATLAPKVRWKADNYNHLFEQPVLFYAVALSLAVLGDGSSFSVGLAWTYVALRVVHSLWQSTRNIIEVRFGLFFLSALTLLALWARAVWLVV
jgi:hypothetical protein